MDNMAVSKLCESLADKKEMAFKIVCQIFNVVDLKRYQKESLLRLSEGKDCFICQPTGSGKSIVFQALPFFVHSLNLLKNAEKVEDITSDLVLKTCKQKVLVISPLISIIKDQEQRLQEKKIKVSTLTTANNNSFKTFSLDQSCYKKQDKVKKNK